MEKKQRKSILLIVLLLLVGLTTGYVASTYAKYTSEITGKEGTAVIAKWNFDEENKDITMNIDFAKTYDPTTLVADRIAPGTEGSFAIQLTNETTETGVDYTMFFGEAIGVPTNLKFYTDADYKTELDITSQTITGTLDAGDATGETITLYWKWAYETTNGDSADTTNGKTGGSDGTKLTLPITITGVQAQTVEKQ